MNRRRRSASSTVPDARWLGTRVVMATVIAVLICSRTVTGSVPSAGVIAHPTRGMSGIDTAVSRRFSSSYLARSTSAWSAPTIAEINVSTRSGCVISRDQNAELVSSKFGQLSPERQDVSDPIGGEADYTVCSAPADQLDEFR